MKVDMWVGAALVHPGPYNKVPQTEKLLGSRNRFLTSWRLEVQDQGVGMACYREEEPPGCRLPSLLCALVVEREQGCPLGSLPTLKRIIKRRVGMQRNRGFRMM